MPDIMDILIISLAILVAYPLYGFFFRKTRKQNDKGSKYTRDVNNGIFKINKTKNPYFF